MTKEQTHDNPHTSPTGVRRHSPRATTYRHADRRRAGRVRRSGVAEERRLRVAIAALRSREVDGIILACTEFPLALSAPLDTDIINPAELLAEAAVCAALV